jgi:hypothetical protein
MYLIFDVECRHSSAVVHLHGASYHRRSTEPGVSVGDERGRVAQARDHRCVLNKVGQGGDCEVGLSELGCGCCGTAGVAMAVSYWSEYMRGYAYLW